MKRGPIIGLIYNPSQVFFEFKTTVLKRFIALATFLKKICNAQSLQFRDKMSIPGATTNEKHDFVSITA
jgi:hypothetical protein